MGPGSSYKWSEITPISRGYNSSYPFIRPFRGVITAFITGTVGAHLVGFPGFLYNLEGINFFEDEQKI